MVNTRSSALSAICKWPPADLEFAKATRSPWYGWASGVSVMAQGNYRAAFATLEEVGACGVQEVSGLAAATIASGYRQLGMHPEAVAHDERAVASHGVATLDGLIGRAADEIGLGVPDRCADYLAEAREFLPEVPEQSHRGAVRISWVEAELALLLGNSAVEPANAAVEGAKRLRSPRHLLKSQLIQGVAWQVVGDSRGRIQLVKVGRSAHSLGIATLVWPSVLALGAKVPRELGVMALRDRSFISEHLPQGSGKAWLKATNALTGEQ